MERARHSSRQRGCHGPCRPWSLSGRVLGRPRPWRTPGPASRVGASMRPSWRLAGLRRTPSGVSRRSTTRWRFVPGLPRSVGFGPVSAPPLLPPPWHRRARPGSSPAAHHRPGAPGARGEAWPRRQPPASRASAARTSSPSSPARAAAFPTGCQIARHEDDAAQGRTIIEPRSAALGLRRLTRQQRLDGNPEVVGYHRLAHAPPTQKARFCWVL